VLSCRNGVSPAQSPFCDCGQRQTMKHIVDTCPLTKFEGGLNLLHEADDDAVIWLESTATAAVAKYKISVTVSMVTHTYIHTYIHTHTHTRLTALFPGLPG